MRTLLLALFLTATAAANSTAQQLPAGTRDAAAPPVTDPNFTRAEAALEKGDFATAATLLRTLAATHSKDAQILYDLGYAEERLDHDDAASKAYEAAIAVSPDTPEPRIALGLLDARAGRLDKAHTELAAVAGLATAPPQLRARAFRALAQIDETARPADAREELLAAVRLTGETAGDAAMTASLADHAGDATEAEAAFRRALKLHPDDPDAAAGLAHILVQSNRAGEAAAVLAEPLKTHPTDPRLASQMASVYASQGNVKAAIPLLEQLRADPRLAADPALNRQLARLLMADNQNAPAEQMFRDAIAKQPDDPSLLDDLGTVLVRQQKYPEAESVLGKAVSMRDKFTSPQAFGDAAGHLAFACSKAGHPEAVLQALKLRATVLPNSGPTLFLEATAADSLHRYKDAERAYRAFLAIAGGQFPDYEFQAKHRLVALEHMK